MHKELNRNNGSYWLLSEWSYFAWIFQDIFSFPTITNYPKFFDQLDVAAKDEKEKKEKRIAICHLWLIISGPTLFYTLQHIILGLVNWEVFYSARV